MQTHSVQIQCPYCGETIDILVDGSLEMQSYIEDCQVCCRPMELSVTLSDDAPAVVARRDDE